MKAKSFIPEGYHSVTPYLTVRDAEGALDFYCKAFGAEVKFKMQGPDGSIVHAEIQIGDSIIMLADEKSMPEAKSPQALGGSPVGLMIYVPDVDAMAKAMVTAGGQTVREVQDQFYGDRSGTFQDPFGHVWTLSTHTEDLTPDELGKRSREFQQQHLAQH